MTDEELPDDVVRSAEEVARRTLALSSVYGVAMGGSRQDISAWLETESLWDALSPTERAFLKNAQPSQRETINLSWRSEGLLLLLWALALIDDLPAANEQCDTAVFRWLLPPYSDVSVADFLFSASLRSEEELIKMANQCLDLHWAARDAHINGRPKPPNVDIEIVQERHLAINWVTGYCNLPWDEVTTDT